MTFQQWGVLATKSFGSGLCVHMFPRMYDDCPPIHIYIYTGHQRLLKLLCSSFCLIIHSELVALRPPLPIVQTVCVFDGSCNTHKRHVLRYMYKRLFSCFCPPGAMDRDRRLIAEGS